ncbi:hypothetical protein [Kitasatospora sp. NPDC096204]|uniref:hypothetical protein n=1 Tax=Kitasatospora sp. NPDC096204 TaxID=3364094 RepID=UPI0038220935
MDLDQALWEMWKSADVPEGYRLEIIDDQDDGGAVTVLTDPDPDPEHRDDACSTRVAHGKEAVIPEGPAKGFVIGPDSTGERRG